MSDQPQQPNRFAPPPPEPTQAQNQQRANEQGLEAVKNDSWASQVKIENVDQNPTRPGEGGERQSDGSFAQNMPARGRGKGNETIGPERAPSKPNQFAYPQQDSQQQDSQQQGISR